MIVLRIGRFGVLWSSQLLSNVGDWLLIVAVPVYVFHLTNSPLATGLAFVAETLPGLLLAPFAGVLVDRCNRLSIMVGSDLRAPLGGALYTLCGFGPLVLIDAGTYLVSAVMLGVVRRHQDSPPAVSGETEDGAPMGDPRRVLGDLRAGFSFLLDHLVLRGLFLVSALFLMANGALNVLLVPYAITWLRTDSGGIGALFSALGLCYLLSAYLGRAISNGGRLRPGIVACLLMAAVCFAGLFNIHHYPAALISIGLLGLPGGALLMVVQVQVQRQTPQPLLGRISSVSAPASERPRCGAGDGLAADHRITFLTF